MLRGLMQLDVVFLAFFLLFLASGDGSFTTSAASKVLKSISDSINTEIEEVVLTNYAGHMVVKH